MTTTNARRSLRKAPSRAAPCYGRAFAEVYDHGWSFWGDKMWKFLGPRIKREFPAATTWLDLCCGGGSLLGHVCEAGYEGVGVDISPHQLRFARRNVPDARFIRGDVRHFDLGRKFDIVTCMFDSLNYLTSLRDLTRAMRAARRHLSPGGMFIFDMNTYLGLQRHWNDRTSGCCESDYAIIMKTSFDERNALGKLEISGFVRRGRSRLYEKFREVHIERGYHPSEIETSLRDLGFSFEVLEGNKLRPNIVSASRLLYICKRTKER